LLYEGPLGGMEGRDGEGRVEGRERKEER